MDLGINELSAAHQRDFVLKPSDEQAARDIDRYVSRIRIDEWIKEQLVKGGVDETVAVTRVAAMTDAQVAQIHQRIDEAPAGGGTAETIIIIGLVLVITELMGYTDIIPSWPAE